MKINVCMGQNCPFCIFSHLPIEAKVMLLFFRIVSILTCIVFSSISFASSIEDYCRNHNNSSGDDWKVSAGIIIFNKLGANISAGRIKTENYNSCVSDLRQAIGDSVKTFVKRGNNCTVSCDTFCDSATKGEAVDGSKKGGKCISAKYIDGVHKGNETDCSYETGRMEGPDFVPPKAPCELECKCADLSK